MQNLDYMQKSFKKYSIAEAVECLSYNIVHVTSQKLKIWNCTNCFTRDRDNKGVFLFEQHAPDDLD